MSMRKTFIVRDPMNDDFAGTDIRPRPLPADYVWRTNNRLRRLLDSLLHHVIATPLAFLYQKLVWHERLVGRRRIRPYLRQGVYLYGNHTRAAGDAFTPSLAAFPRRPFVLVHPDAVAVPGLRQVVRALGGIPVPTDIRNLGRFHGELLKLSPGIVWSSIPRHTSGPATPACAPSGTAPSAIPSRPDSPCLPSLSPTVATSSFPFPGPWCTLTVPSSPTLPSRSVRTNANCGTRYTMPCAAAVRSRISATTNTWSRPRRRNSLAVAHGRTNGICGTGKRKKQPLHPA